MESSSVIIRNYVKESDLQGCAFLLRELTEWHREMYENPLTKWGPIESDYDRDLDTVDPSLFWVVVHGSKVIGMVGLLKEGRWGKDAEVEPIMVTREFSLECHVKDRREHCVSDSELRVGYEPFLFKRSLQFCDGSVYLRLFLAARTNELSASED